MTALAEALQAHGYETADARLNALALTCITLHAKNYQAAYNAFRDEVLMDRTLTWALFARFEEAAIRPVLAKAAQEYHRRHKPKVVGGGRSIIGKQTTNASTQNKAAQMAVAAVVRKSLLDTFQINGQPLGDVSAAVAKSWAMSRRRDARFVELLTAGIHETDMRPLRAIVRPEEAENAMKQAGRQGNE